MMIAKYFENLVSPFPDEAPSRPPGTLWGFIGHYAKPFKWLFVASVVLSAGIALLEVFAFELVGNVVDWMLTTEPGGFWSAHGMQVLLICGMIAVLWPLLSLLDDLVLLQGILGNMPMSIRWRGHRYLLRQSTSFYAEDFAGRIATKLMQSSLGVREVLVKLTNLFVYFGVYFVATLVLFAGNSLWLALPLLVWVTLYSATGVYFLPKLRKWSEKQSDARSALTGRVVDAYTNIQTVKLFASDKAEDAYAREGMTDMMDTVYPQMRLATGMSFAIHLINGFFIAGTLGLGTLLWSNGQMTAGALAFATTIALRIQGLSHYFLWELSALFENLGASDDGRKTLSQPLAVQDTDTARDLPSAKGAIAFEKVGFHYGKQQSVIGDLNLSIGAGEKVGLVGRSGAGKSTLVNLLLRLYDVESGRITVDGTNIAEVTQDSLRRQIDMVTQDTSLLHRSIRENIAYGRPGASDKEIQAASERAEAWEFIQTLEDKKGRQGLDAHVGERGVKLSGGQRQRIALARVILKDAPILILDEATAALDSEVEAAIQEQLLGLMSGKTVIAIAHRLSTIAAMDRLVVLDHGQIVEMGTHADLIEAGGLYAGLWARQSGGFIDAGDGTATAAE